MELGGCLAAGEESSLKEFSCSEQTQRASDSSSIATKPGSFGFRLQVRWKKKKKYSAGKVRLTAAPKGDGLWAEGPLLLV